MMLESLAQEIVSKFKAARICLLVLHRNPDPDSLGSAAAMAAFLEAQNISYRFYCESQLPDTAQFFGISRSNCLNPQEVIKIDPDLIATFDAGDLVHAGLKSIDYKKPSPLIVNFDHHSTNTRFGALNVIDTSCSSTTEVIYQFFKAINFPIRARTASYLLAGLLTDTDHFFNPATTSSSLSMASELMARGVSLPFTRQLLFERHGISALRLIGLVLSRLRKNPRYDIAVTYVTEEDLEKHKITFDDIESAANILNAIGDAKAMALVKYEKGLVRVSFRTTREDVNLGKLAETLGGGGHKKAAGFRVPGALQVEGGRVKVL